MIDSSLNTIVSGFKNYQSTEPYNVNLLDWLMTDMERVKVEYLRTIQDENLQKVIKASLPAISPSGRFERRSTKHFIDHSGFLAFDIDYADNKHISNWENLKEQVSHINCVAYCGVSVRGNGYWGLVRIPKCTPEEHKNRFKALYHDFKTLGIELDNQCSDITRLRIYSFDPNPYLNHNAEIYTKIAREPATLKKVYPQPNQSDTKTKVDSVLQQIIIGQIDITDNYKEEWFTIAAALANEFGEAGRGYFHSISRFNSKYNPQISDRQFDRCLNNRYSKISIGSFFKIAGDYGIKIRNQASYKTRKSEIHSKPDIPSTSKLIAPLNEEVITNQSNILRNFSSLLSFRNCYNLNH